MNNESCLMSASHAAVLNLNDVEHEPVGDQYYQVTGVFRVYTGEHHLDIQRDFMIRRDLSDWVLEVDRQRATLRTHPFSYDAVVFVRMK